MRASIRSSVPNEPSDAVGLVVALLVRYPELATLTARPAEGTLVLSFAVDGPLERASQRAICGALVEHVAALHEVAGEPVGRLSATCERDERMTFVRVARDAESFSREELELLVALLRERFGERLLRNPPPEDDLGEEAGRDELVEHAIEALRDPSHRRNLVGFREEMRVMVYFVNSRKKAKARARS
ncbi:MAG: hypothetical protein ACREM2_06120 [Vulcanimicrobiaceae bacterium]